MTQTEKKQGKKKKFLPTTTEQGKHKILQDQFATFQKVRRFYRKIYGPVQCTITRSCQLLWKHKRVPLTSLTTVFCFIERRRFHFCAPLQIKRYIKIRTPQTPSCILSSILSLLDSAIDFSQQCSCLFTCRKCSLCQLEWR